MQWIVYYDAQVKTLHVFVRQYNKYTVEFSGAEKCSDVDI